MAGKLHVVFGDPVAGQVRLTVTHGIEFAEIAASYLYNGFLELTLALHRLLFTQGESVVTWRSEALETEMRFVRMDESVYLEIDVFTEGRRASRGRRLLFASGDYDEICLPFWRSLRTLQGRYSGEDLQRRWPGFPSNEINKLSAAIELHGKAGNTAEG